MPSVIRQVQLEVQYIEQAGISKPNSSIKAVRHWWLTIFLERLEIYYSILLVYQKNTKIKKEVRYYLQKAEKGKDKDFITNIIRSWGQDHQEGDIILWPNIFKHNLYPPWKNYRKTDQSKEDQYKIRLSNTEDQYRLD